MPSDRPPLKISNVELRVGKASGRLYTRETVRCMECTIPLLIPNITYSLDVVHTMLERWAIEVAPDEYHGYCKGCMEIFKVCPL